MPMPEATKQIDEPSFIVGDPGSYGFVPVTNLRDWFAGLAMQSFAKAWFDRTNDGNEGPWPFNDVQDLCKTAYVYADAMLAARKAGR